LDREKKELLSSWMSGKRTSLIYVASQDGFSAVNFHSKCDNKGPTIVLVKSDSGHLFGGYASLSWSSNAGYQAAEESFLFTLTNPHNIPPTKYVLSADRKGNAMCSQQDYGPIFGGGSDLCICNDSHNSTESHSNFPYSYTDTTGKGKETFAGACIFKVKEIEVFQIL
jgi:BTB/POZ domain-containing protein KCTD9